MAKTSWTDLKSIYRQQKQTQSINSNYKYIYVKWVTVKTVPITSYLGASWSLHRGLSLRLLWLQHGRWLRVSLYSHFCLCTHVQQGWSPHQVEEPIQLPYVLSPSNPSSILLIILQQNKKIRGWELLMVYNRKPEYVFLNYNVLYLLHIVTTINW